MVCTVKTYIVKPLVGKPGIQRDGTRFASQSYIDGQWCRFYMNRPRKIGGYKLIDAGNSEIITSLYGVSKSNSADLYLGRASNLRFNNFTANGEGEGEVDRTPTTYLTDFPDPEQRKNITWSFDLYTIQDDTLIVAAAIENRNDINNKNLGYIYYGSINDNLPLVKLASEDGNIRCSGGILFLAPILIAYGEQGTIQFSDPGGNINDGWDNFQVIANTKIIQAYNVRGSNGSFIAWTTTSVVTGTLDISGSDPRFITSTIQDNITVISPESIIQYNQQFFWMGVNKFYYYNGIVQVLDNDMSYNYIFNNIDLTHRTKVFGIVIPDYDELWWFYVSKSSSNGECDSAAIYNMKLAVWYDSKIDRSCGLSPGVLPLPVLCSSKIEDTSLGRGVTNTYPLWLHEYGVDKEIGNIKLAIDSYYETPFYTLFQNDAANNRLLRNRRIEPDFVQTGNMTVTVNNRMFPKDTPISAGPYPFSDSTTKIDDVVSQGRFVSFIFRSNEAGGGYQAGQPLLDYQAGDVNP